MVILFSTDLATQSKVAGALAGAGRPCQVAMSAARLRDLLDAAPQAVVALDLATVNSAVELIEELRHRDSPPRAVLAFGPHVHETALEAARAAGADGVFARGQFLLKAGELVRQWSVE